MIYVLDMYNCTSKLYIPSTIHTKYIFWHTLIVYAVAYFDHKKYTAKIDSFLSFNYVYQFFNADFTMPRILIF